MRHLFGELDGLSFVCFCLAQAVYQVGVFKGAGGILGLLSFFIQGSEFQAGGIFVKGYPPSPGSSSTISKNSV